MQHTILSFPEISLRQSDGHKLRGYFAQQFGEDSDLFHNHGQDNATIYRYPLIQFKVVKGVPIVIGIEEGAQLLVERFIKLRELVIEAKTYALNQKNLKSDTLQVGVIPDLVTYTFDTPWMALNQKNYDAYQRMSEIEKHDKLKRILVGNILSFYKGIRHHETKTIMVQHQLNPILTKFKDQPMLAFKGQFTTNAMLPDYIGLGKSVARGYGTVTRSR